MYVCMYVCMYMRVYVYAYVCKSQSIKSQHYKHESDLD